MIKSLRFLVTAILATVLLMLSTGLTYRVAVHSIVNRSLIPTLLLYKDLLSASPGHRRVINQTTTLLYYASIELGESKERQLISRLLDSSIGDGARLMSSWSTATVWERQRQKAFLQYFPHRYAKHWTEFHLALKSWVKNKRFHPQVMAELGDLVKTPLDRHYNGTVALEIRPGQPYQSCAVVGNGGILLHKAHGPLIDSHEMVIRLNNARIEGFEDRVGSKTSLAFINSNILHSCARRAGCFCHPYGENVPIMLYICQAVHFMDFALCNASHKAPLLVTDARFDKLCGRVVKYYSLKNFVETTGKNPDEWSAAHEGPMFHYSSGMQAVMLALGICKNVSLFGFGKSPEAKHHYHTNQKGELALHDYEAEYQLYRDLSNGSPDIPFLKEAGIELPPVQIYL
jgi:hypothetical protein